MSSQCLQAFAHCSWLIGLSSDAQVAAHTNGRDTINKFDCLLLQHMLWQRPEESQRILDFLLERLAIESSTQQTDYLFDGTPQSSSVVRQSLMTCARLNISALQANTVCMLSCAVCIAITSGSQLSLRFPCCMDWSLSATYLTFVAMMLA